MLLRSGRVQRADGADSAGQSSSPELQETVVASNGKTKQAKVAIIEVEGLLANATTGGGFLGTRGERGQPASDSNWPWRPRMIAVKAVVLRINSPGGTVAASEAMYSDVHAVQT